MCPQILQGITNTKLYFKPLLLCLKIAVRVTFDQLPIKDMPVPTKRYMARILDLLIIDFLFILPSLAQNQSGL